jgi:hypothetical protein
MSKIASSNDQLLCTGPFPELPVWGGGRKEK